MDHIKLKDIITETQSRSWMKESLEKDLAYLQEKLIEEGLWDAIKQKVGGVLDKTSDKAKELLLKPLVKVIMDKVAKDDPQGFEQLQQHAAQNPKNIEKLLNHPDIKKQQNKVEKELQSVKESLTEQQEDDFIQEYIDAVLEEAKILKDDPRNIRRRERYAQRRTARAAASKTPEPQSKAEKQPRNPTDKKEKPSATDDIKKGAAQLGKGLAKTADKLGVAAIEKTGDFLKGAGDLAKKGMDTQAGQAVKGAIGGLVSKVYGWAKSHPKITAAVALGLLGALFTAASIGSGGIVPLVTSTLAAAGGGALKGGAVGGAIGAGKEMYSQIKGGAKSFGDMDYKKVGAGALKTGAKGAAIGAAVGAGANILGKAVAGISNMFSSGVSPSNPNDFLQDLTPAEQRALGIEGKTWAEKYNPNDMKTWKIKPSINSTQGYIMAQQENDLLRAAIMKGQNVVLPK
jgi:hypothetical protein